MGCWLSRQVSIKRCVSSRTVDRINGIARYRKYRALSEQITRERPREELVKPDEVKPGELPEKVSCVQHRLVPHASM
eukprot:scaffold98617_cov42-Prasinocladus_malaysianus.AAC.2